MSSSDEPVQGTRQPGGRSSDRLDAIEALLEERVAANQEELLDPWREMMKTSPDLQGEIQQTVRVLKIFFRKWVVEIMFVLGQQEALRFNELKRSLDGISSRTLSKRLTELDEQGLVDRTVFDEMPVRVEYSLTEKGRDVAALALPLILYLRLHGTQARAPEA